MIDIPEERILEEITDILMNDLPKVLLELEEQSENSIRLPPFRYVGLKESLPPGTGLPYAFVEIEEGTYTAKDRMIKNVVYTLQLTLKLADTSYIWRYKSAIKKAIEQNDFPYGRINLGKTNKTGLIALLVKTL